MSSAFIYGNEESMVRKDFSKQKKENELYF
jgi:hypothetical protein